MFDIGFWELVVIGPERLPEVVRSALIFIRKIRRAFSDVRADIERELDLDDMRKILREADMREHIKKLNDGVMNLDKEARDLGTSIKEDLEHAYDGYTPEDASAEADTGIEPPAATGTDKTPPAADTANTENTPPSGTTAKP